MIIPSGVSLKDFAGSLLIDFPNDNIPILSSDKDWKVWGSLLIQETSFANNGAPGPGLYKSPNDWTKALFKAMASFP